MPKEASVTHIFPDGLIHSRLLKVLIANLPVYVFSFETGIFLYSVWLQTGYIAKDYDVQLLILMLLLTTCQVQRLCLA